MILIENKKTFSAIKNLFETKEKFREMLVSNIIEICMIRLIEKPSFPVIEYIDFFKFSNKELNSFLYHLLAYTRFPKNSNQFESNVKRKIISALKTKGASISGITLNKIPCLHELCSRTYASIDEETTVALFLKKILGDIQQSEFHDKSIKLAEKNKKNMILLAITANTIPDKKQILIDGALY